MDDEWLIIHTPAGSWVWNLGQPTVDEREDLIHRARIVAGFPANNDWVGSNDTAVMLTSGRPHDQLMTRAIQGTVAELRTVDAGAVVEYAAAMTAVHRHLQIEAARAALLTLDPVALAAVLAHPEVAARTAP